MSPLTNWDPLRKPSMIPATKAAQFRLPGSQRRDYKLSHSTQSAGYDSLLVDLLHTHIALLSTSLLPFLGLEMQ